jgi:short-subunit dehydrogenase
MDNPERQLAVITGASTPIGLEFARLYAEDKFDLIITGAEPMIHRAAWELGELGVNCDAVQCDLATPAYGNQLAAAIAGRPVDALLAIVGLGFGKDSADGKLEERFEDIQANIDGTVRLVFAVAREMRQRGKGHITIIGSLAELVPGIAEAVYYCSKAFLDSFAVALANELKDSGVTVTCLMPGAARSGERGRAPQVAKPAPDRIKRGNLKLVVGAGNRLHAVMHRGQAHFSTQGHGLRPYPLSRKFLQ